jgi:outer membrane lipoprotein carrier protein
MLKSISILCAVFTLSTQVVLAKPTKTPHKKNAEEYSALKAVSKKYQGAGLVEMLVEKTVKSELMGKETKYLGKISLSAGLFRWENTQPEKSLLVFDGQNIWNEQASSPDFPGETQVARARVDKKNKSKILISSLMGRVSIFENFKILKEEKVGDLLTYSIQPKVNDLNISQLRLSLSAKEKKVVEISYQDDVGNTTEMKFSSIDFKKKTSSSRNLFKYTPPKGAQVTNI